MKWRQQARQRRHVSAGTRNLRKREAAKKLAFSYRLDAEIKRLVKGCDTMQEQYTALSEGLKNMRRPDGKYVRVKILSKVRR